MEPQPIAGAREPIGVGAVRAGTLLVGLDRGTRADRGQFERAQPQDFLALGARQDRKKHTSELQSLMRISYAVFCLKKKRLDMKSCRESKQQMLQVQKSCDK